MIIRTLLVGENKDFYLSLLTHLEEEIPGIEFQLKHLNKVELDSHYDIYLIDFGKGKITRDLIHSIRSYTPHARIFIVFRKQDSGFLKDIFSLDVAGFLDGDNFDATPIIEIIKRFTLTEKFTTVSESILKEKLIKLSSATKSLRTHLLCR